MTPLFNIVDGSLVEQSRMTEPNPPNYRYWEDYEEDMFNWTAHIASLRSYPIVSEEDWVKKEGLVEGVDFEIIKGDNWNEDHCSMDAFVAIPIKPATTLCDYCGYDLPNHEDRCLNKPAETDSFTQKHLAKIKEKMKESMIEMHIKSNLEYLRPSIKYFLESGTVSGEFYLSLMKMMSPVLLQSKPAERTQEEQDDLWKDIVSGFEAHNYTAALNRFKKSFTITRKP